jgi:hypothetical protein
MSAKAHRAAQQDDRVSVASAKISDEPTSKSSKFRIRKNEPIPEGIKRIVAGQIDKGIERLGSAELDDDEAIHDARVCSKKIRAVLRLVRGELGRKVYKRENACFRDAARRLSHVRDTAALVEILDKVRAKCPDECELKAFSVEIGELTDHLSVDHDLAALRRAISAMPPTSELPSAGIESLLSLIARARLEARAGARLLGDRIYAEKPAVFTRRMGGYWDSSRRKGMS